MRVIAEGVENKEHLDLLQKLGCDSIQGFYLSEALPRNKISSLLTTGVPGITNQVTSSDIEETRKKIAENTNKKVASALN